MLKTDYVAGQELDANQWNQAAKMLNTQVVAGATTESLNTALSLSKSLLVAENLVIETTTTIPQDAVLTVAKGAVITTTGGASLLIKGKIDAGPYQVFDPAAAVKIRPYAALEIYPEWFGAVALDNPRTGTVAAGAVDSTAAIKKALTSIESSVYGSKTFGGIIRMSGWYGISDQITVRGGYKFVGTTPEMEGSGLRWLGNPDPTKSMLYFIEAEYGGVEGIGFRGRGSNNANGGLKAAIEMTWLDGLHTQRRMNFERLAFGNPIGYFAGDNTLFGYDFEHAIYCSGSSGNNDFHTIRNVIVADTKIGIRTEIDQSVEWFIDDYGMNYGETMYQADMGGSVIGNRWYGEANYGPIIKTLGSISQELRISIANFSSEYLRGPAFIDTSCKMKFVLSGENFIAINGDYLDPNDGYALIKGGGNNFDSEYIFENTRLEFGSDGTTKSPGFSNPTPRIYIEQINTAVSLKSIKFINCTGAKDIYFKFPSPLNTNNSTYTLLDIQGEKNTAYGTDAFYQQDKKLMVNVRNPAVTQGVGAMWLHILDVWRGETEIANNTVSIGEKGRTSQSSLSVKGFRGITVNSRVQKMAGVLPANSVIKGVIVKTADTNILTTAYHYMTVGTVRNDSLFGLVSMPNISSNTLPANFYATGLADEDIILKGWYRLPAGYYYTLGGTTLTLTSGSVFDPSVVGSIVRFFVGPLAGKEVKIISVQSGTVATVENPNNWSSTGEEAAIQVPLNGGKPFVVYVTSEKVDKGLNEVDVNFYGTLPQQTAVAVTPVVNEKQFQFNGVAISDSNTSGGQWEIIPEGLNFDNAVTIGEAPLSYSLAGSNYTVKSAVKGGLSTDLTKLVIALFDELSRPVMSMDAAGRQNLFNYSINGAISVLYNLINPAGVNAITAGHFAFGATNNAGNLNTIATILGTTVDRTAAAMSSAIQLSFMDAKDTTGGYSQPNRVVEIGPGGLRLPALPIDGVTTLMAEKVYVNTVSPNAVFQLSVDGIFGVRHQASNGVFYVYPAELPGGVNLQVTSFDLSAVKKMVLNGQGGDVQVGKPGASKVLMDLPVYADEAAATAGGLSSTTLYRTSTGEVRVKL